ncbi:serine carboxypeptidase [Schizosaccharomyces japonicus yFS275]|uniref:Pheromone-processing carboxypeptidase kex1 n=1 Tax=Schizosaccharomyces japonicus (strain yFS275 / FY16936) TaxID=402676 RepID=KEX1_SCHJY|nr:serine carboxypeptidase [Schizosaccharomyces japonicus yFS275]B6K7U7.1 RecName: Full=Pheromone-processing carboxypeptidase kex1; AltName: Full=Carboxypeptidase D; Flags: Precursor [Schizosaccharomyces japonicus yFS275]EEB09601.1 serine carboxypeptidase [Schizosaccharomyces japonicus yFS275]
MSLSFLLRVAGLFFLQFNSAQAKSQVHEQWHVSSIPNVPAGYTGSLHSGYLNLTDKLEGDLFFTLYGSENEVHQNRTIIWLNGGPGCSSEDGSMLELGPLRLTNDSLVYYNAASWVRLGNVLFVDQPMGTGFSFADTRDAILNDNEKMSNDFAYFLQEFVKAFPEYATDTWYIAGESFAGQYIPAIAKKVIDSDIVNLSGIAIGNGWIEPASHYLTYLDYLVERGLLERGSALFEALTAVQAKCLMSLEQSASGMLEDENSCDKYLFDILFSVSDKSGEFCFNMYDVTLTSPYPSCGMEWPLELPALTDFLSSPDVMKALHVASDKVSRWEECSSLVSNFYADTNVFRTRFTIAELLEEIPVMLFYGENDFLCNYVSGEFLISNLEWSGKRGFENASNADWYPRYSEANTLEYGQYAAAAGIIHSERNLTYATIRNSSHMVPYDHPYEMLALVSAFFDNDFSQILMLPDPVTIVPNHSFLSIFLWVMAGILAFSAIGAICYYSYRHIRSRYDSYTPIQEESA